ncbi:MAG: peptidylprolyl isomerase [Candidatus Acidiferrum sp.]
MRNVFVLTSFFILTAPLLAQVAAPTAPARTSGATLARPAAGRRAPDLKSQPAPVEVSPATPVVTLTGVCDQLHAATAKTPCVTVITRADLDRLVASLAPGASDATHRQLAVSYARLLAASTAAHQQHLDQDPTMVKDLQPKSKFARMQVLADALYRKLQDQADNVAPTEIKKYYADHLADFEQADVYRLYIPINARNTAGQPINPAAIKAKAEELRTGAVAGADFEMLQKMAYLDLNIMGVPLPTHLDSLHRGSITPAQAIVFDMQPGEVSPVQESFTGFFVLKLISKTSVPLQSVEPEILSAIRDQHLLDELRTVAADFKADFNLPYLGTASAPLLFPPPAVMNVLTSPSYPDSRTRSALVKRKAPLIPAQSSPNPAQMPSTVPAATPPTR